MGGASSARSVVLALRGSRVAAAVAVVGARRFSPFFSSSMSRTSASGGSSASTARPNPPVTRRVRDDRASRDVARAKLRVRRIRGERLRQRQRRCGNRTSGTANSPRLKPRRCVAPGVSSSTASTYRDCSESTAEGYAGMAGLGFRFRVPVGLDRSRRARRNLNPGFWSSASAASSNATAATFPAWHSGRTLRPSPNTGTAPPSHAPRHKPRKPSSNSPSP